MSISIEVAVLGRDKSKFEILIQSYHGIISHQPWITRKVKKKKHKAKKARSRKKKFKSHKSTMKVENK